MLSLRVAFYSHNGFGLGHVRRSLKLAEGLLRRRPNADVLLLTGSAGLHRFPVPANVDYIKLPSVRKQATGRWRPQALDIEMEHLLRLRQTIILEAIRAYRPHLFVADFLPLGVDGELAPALEELAARDDARTVIGFRDILDDPATVRQTWDTDGTHGAIKDLYDLTLVYGEPTWFDFAAYDLDPDQVRYVGFLGEPDVVIRARPPGDVRMIVTCGGGGDGYAVLAAALEAVEPLQVAFAGKIGCTVLTGPLMPEPDVARLRAIGKRVGGRVHRFADDLQAKLARSTIVVGMAGYNTVCDVLSFRRPAVIVPRPGPSGEQPIRAQIMAKRGLATALPLSQCTSSELARVVLPLFEETTYPEAELPDLHGVERAVDALLELMA
jgi:predicted glycosyltransferase